jgi:hypothetical protein
MRPTPTSCRGTHPLGCILQAQLQTRSAAAEASLAQEKERRKTCKGQRNRLKKILTARDKTSKEKIGELTEMGKAKDEKIAGQDTQLTNLRRELDAANKRNAELEAENVRIIRIMMGYMPSL